MKISAQIDEADRRWLQQTARKFGAVVQSAFIGQVNRLKNRLVKAIYAGGGLYGVPQFAPRSPITEKLHGPQWGGYIKKNELVRKWKGENGAQMIGFPDRNANNKAPMLFGQAIQTAYEREFSREERIQLYRLGFNRKNTPVFSYNRPARPIIAAFAEANFPDLYRETRKKVEKILSDESKIQKINARARQVVLKQLARKR
jgi:hypothetical protein